MGDNIRLYDKYLYNVDVKGGLGIKGSTNDPVITGSIKAKEGTITYLRTKFDLTTGIVSFINKRSIIPQVNLVAKTRFGKYNVYANVNGLATNLNLKLTSSPALDKNTLFRMLVLQDYSGSSAKDGISRDQMESFFNASLEYAILGNVEDQFRRELNLEKFSIYSGSLRVGGFLDDIDSDYYSSEDSDNDYNYLLSKRIFDKWIIAYTASFNNEENYKSLQYELTPKINLVYLIDQDSENTYAAEYTVSF